MNEVNPDFVDRYVALWNEPDAKVRRRTIEDLWAPDGANYTQSMQAIGYDALEVRISSAYEDYVGSGKYYRAGAARAAARPGSRRSAAPGRDYDGYHTGLADQPPFAVAVERGGHQPGLEPVQLNAGIAQASDLDHSLAA